MALPDELGFLLPLQIGISCGILRVGAYGGTSRRTYGVLGDEVNVAARLMQHAVPGEILISGRMQAAIAADFVLEPLLPIAIKGMSEPLPVFHLVGDRAPAVHLPEPAYALPMVGRTAELAMIGEQLDQALTGQGQVVGITADAGMGKSRLLAEVIRLAQQRGLRSFGGACQSYGTTSPYLVWGSIWRGFFDLNPEWPLQKQIRVLAGAVEDMVSARIEALPLLGPLFGLNLTENDFTKTLEPQLRKSALHALLLDCLRVAARSAAQEGSGLLFVLEDLHWLDAASHELLDEIARAIVDMPVLIVLAYRPPELLHLQSPRVEALPHFRCVQLLPLSRSEAEQAIRAKLAQLLPERKGAPTPMLIERITERAQGNPFYVEELLNYLHDRGIDPQDTNAVTALELPASLHSLILSRIDQLSARQQAGLKVASVIGRLFRFAWLHSAYPMLGDSQSLKADLDELARLELTPLHTFQPELVYLFKHIVTQEVTYQSLTRTAQAALHEQLAAYLERVTGDAADQYLDLLAYHYGQGENLDKKRLYLRRAGEAAAARFANDAALDYLSRALALAPAGDLTERYILLRARETVLDRLGSRAAQRQDLDVLAALAEALEDDERRAEVLLRYAQYADATGDYPASEAAAQQAVALARAARVRVSEASGHMAWGRALWRQANHTEAGAHLEQAIAVAQAVQAPDIQARSLNLLGGIAWSQNDYDKARAYSEQALTRYREIGERRGESRALGNLGLLAKEQGDFNVARIYNEQSLRLDREHGDRRGECMILVNLGGVANDQGDYASGRAYCEAGLRLSREIGERTLEKVALSNLGQNYSEQGDYTRAYECYAQILGLSRQTGDRLFEGHALADLGLLFHHLGKNTEAYDYNQRALLIAREAGDRNDQAAVLTNLGHALVELARIEEARDAYLQALSLYRTLGRLHMAAKPLAGLARLALEQGDTTEALNHITPILSNIQTSKLDSTDEQFRIELTCYQVLRANGDPRAQAVLGSAYARLEDRAAKISDEALQHSFLHNVLHHRALLAAWAETVPET
jgi:tetratricopeptide (TPR) repeat protein